MSMICESVVVSGEVPCEGCHKPILKGQLLSQRAGTSVAHGRAQYHEQCHTEAMLNVRDPQVSAGATRGRLEEMRAQIQRGPLEADALRAVLLALLDEVLR